MEIQQLIYTKVPQQESPWKKTDYHTVFYPTGFLTRGELADVERKIHFQGQSICDHKLAWFWQQISGIYYLVILRLQTLPDEVDWQGRVGSFLCHTFFFPPELWKNTPRPLACLELVKDHIITSSSGALSSPSVDQNTGNMAPLSLQESEWQRYDQQIPNDLSDEQWRLALALIRSATLNIQSRPVILCKGPADFTADLFDRLFACVPTDLKILLAFDSAMDGANLAQCPIRIGGFSQRLSYGTNVLLITTDPWKIDTTGKWHELFLPSTPFERWFYGCRDEVVVTRRIDEVYLLSSQLLSDTISNGNKSLLLDCQGFIEVNRQFIDDTFQERCAARTGAPAAHLFNDLISKDAKLEYLLRGIPFQQLAEELEKLILADPNLLNTLAGTIPAPLVQAGSLRLQLIASFCQGRKDMLNRLEELDIEQAEALIRFLADNSIVDKKLLRKLMEKRRDLFDQLLASSPSLEILIRDIMLSTMRETKLAVGVEEIVVDQAISQGKCNALLSGEVMISSLLNEFVKQGAWQKADLKPILRWASHDQEPNPFREYLFLAAVVNPDFINILLRQLNQYIPQECQPTQNTAKPMRGREQVVPALSRVTYKEQSFSANQGIPKFFEIQRGEKRPNDPHSTLMANEENIRLSRLQRRLSCEWQSMARHEKLIDYLMTERKVGTQELIGCGFDGDTVQRVAQSHPTSLLSRFRALLPGSGT